MVAAPAQSGCDAVLAHPADHQDGDRECPVSQTQQPQRPTCAPGETGQDSTDSTATALTPTPVRHQASQVRSAASQVRREASAGAGSLPSGSSTTVIQSKWREPRGSAAPDWRAPARRRG